MTPKNKALEKDLLAVLEEVVDTRSHSGRRARGKDLAVALRKLVQKVSDLERKHDGEQETGGGATGHADQIYDILKDQIG